MEFSGTGERGVIKWREWSHWREEREIRQREKGWEELGKQLILFT